MRLSKIALALAFAARVPLLSQVPDFKGDPAQIMLECANKARSIEGKDSRLLAEYGRAYLAAGQRDKAEEAFKQAIASDPKDGETHFLIGYAWLRQGFKDEALKAFALMESADPKAKNAFTRAAVVLVDAGEEAAAAALMEKAYRLDLKDWQNPCEFGRACLRNGKPGLASLWFQRTVVAKPKEERMWNEIALAYADKGTPARSIF